MLYHNILYYDNNNDNNDILQHTVNPKPLNPT